MAWVFAPIVRGGVNCPEDVKLVQQLLNAKVSGPSAILANDGIIGPKTISAIENFQRGTLGMASPGISPILQFLSLTGFASVCFIAQDSQKHRCVIRSYNHKLAA
jgi:hypothetical protein